MATFAERLGSGIAVGIIVVGCSGSAAQGVASRRADAMPPRGLQAPIRGLDDPTLRGARFLPVTLDEAHAWGVEAGNERAVVAGLRVLSSAGGDLAAAADRLPANPSSVAELPDRLGGGFLLAMGAHVWRSNTWLGPAQPVFTHSSPIADVLIGLDRVYLRAEQGALVAIDPRTGANLDLGPLPASPRIVSLAALDAWRAIAVADLRGTVMTLDAGSSWRSIALPIEAARAIAMPDAFAVGGFDLARTTAWWQVLPDGQTARIATPSPSGTTDRAGTLQGTGLPPLGARPMQAAIQDGWPLTDGTALVARDGFLVRVRLRDGSIVERIPDAFFLRPARCHPLSLARPADRGAFGFVCGEPQGRSAIFRWDAASSHLVELRRFESPRAVLGSGNGALAVRGPCDGNGADGGRRGRTLCVMDSSGRWREARLSGAGVERARVVVLSSGRLVLVQPPEDGDLSTASLRLTDGTERGGQEARVPLRIELVRPEVARALRFGVWMDGFEERRPGVVGGWIDAAGALLGVEISLDGEVRVGEFIGDAGEPVAAGRWAFGWTRSRRGFETTDGGMTWTQEITLPEPIAEPRAGRERSCGPIGCVIAGWLRIGWGSPDVTALVEPPPVRARPVRRAPKLSMDCEGWEAAPIAPSGSARQPLPPRRVPSIVPRSPGSGSALNEFRPFAGRSPSPVPAGDVGLSVDATHLLDRVRSRPLGRLYTWGPSSGDWETSGRWQVLWSWPWGESRPGVRSSAASAPPWSSLEVARRSLGIGLGLPPDWNVVPGDDADHALLVQRRATLGPSLAGGGGVLTLETLEADRAPTEARPASGAPWSEFQGAVRTEGHWYISTSQDPGELAATVVWVIDGTAARQIGRVSRVSPEVSGPGRLTRRAGPRMGSGHLGLVVNGPDPDRGPLWWVSSFDQEARAFGVPEVLAPADLSDRTVVPCSGDEGGWEIEATFPGTIDVRIGALWSARLQTPLARLRVWHDGACVDDVFGAADSQAARTDEAIATRDAGIPTPGLGPSMRTLSATVVTDHTTTRLRCRLRSP